jgi:hypothetical protein
LVLAQPPSFDFSLAFPFVFRVMVLTIDFYWIFGCSFIVELIATD